ncbi:dihydrodipicolinate synthase family protein [Chloroflexota bacterium]
MAGLEGIHFMMPTPFDEEGMVNTESIPALVNLAVKAGCRGVVCLGVTGEVSRLTDAERKLVVETVIREVKQKLTVTVGTSAMGIEIAVQRSLEAKELGATAVMMTPAPVAKQNLDAVFNYYEAVASAVNIPIVVQDYPRESNVFMPPNFVARLCQELDEVKYLKLEDPPTPPKITAIKKLVGDSLGIFGGLGGTFLYEELNRGACGTMTGFAYPEILVKVYNHISRGETGNAAEVFYRYLPLIRYEFQEGIGLSLRKEVLKYRGILRCAKVRYPAAQIDEVTRQELYRLLETLELT